ncbi:hypothetical protein GCM10010112_21240 [Actinoplanes lobatus]|uniref:Uncharacterized protein n=1 Tax=Actinoplanes lobatus TaxID=113568 RepID=A0A7W7HPU4_9ACTN|nr:hypothetical protein [Actinoplanes lobatus]MBB4754379.1 hypothetical protein [Actinoplanes lobatus]GGN62733.1 hypothetical protein GCM10010112_21240 [Actinoplanes lobatus]GIE40542.1 hypothetical protein Alo02nite_34400 [Actinoplanes lobatus]
MPLLDPGARREYLEPAAVILAGVLAVVAFGLIMHARANSGGQPEEPDPIAAPTTTADQIPIPLPSASLPPSMTPINAISIERVPVAGTVDLAAEGTIDWVHWGEQGRFSLERDAGGEFAILEGTPTAPRVRHAASPQRFAWNGGEPMAESSGVTSGINTCGTGNGFTVTAPAGTGRNVLTVYVGAISARGDIRIKLSTGGEPVTDILENREPTMTTAAYVISYQASGTGKISVEWITGATFDDTCGGVALQAATLS